MFIIIYLYLVVVARNLSPAKPLPTNLLPNPPTKPNLNPNPKPLSPNSYFLYIDRDQLQDQIQD